MIDVSLLGGSNDLIKSSQSLLGSESLPTCIYWDPQKTHNQAIWGPGVPKGGGPQTPKNFWELFIKSKDPLNKDTSINFTPSQILEGQYVLPYSRKKNAGVV